MKAAVHQCVRMRSFSADGVKSVLNFLPPQDNKVVDISLHPLLQVKTDGIRDASEYDSAFLGQEGIV